MYTALMALLVFLPACAYLTKHSGSVLMHDIDKPLAEIRSIAIQNIPGGLRGVSANGRDLYSKHFVLKNNRPQPAGDALERFYSQITILGDRRPYTLEILITREKRISRGEATEFEVVGYNESLADEVAKKIQRALTKRREDRNVIDGFRAF